MTARRRPAGLLTALVITAPVALALAVAPMASTDEIRALPTLSRIFDHPERVSPDGAAHSRPPARVAAH